MLIANISHSIISLFKWAYFCF